MTLIRPTFIVLDTATLAKVSRDYWSDDASLRSKARALVGRLQEESVYLVLTATHLFELLGHGNDRLVSDRFSFLKSLPLIAWPRPYDRSWLPGTAVDLHRHELHAAVHGGMIGWRQIIERVRDDLWETGTGSDMFVDNEILWQFIRTGAQLLQKKAREVVSVLRANPGGELTGATVREMRKLPRRTNDERGKYLHRLARELNERIRRHGDQRLDSSRQLAIGFTEELASDYESIALSEVDVTDAVLAFVGVPKSLVTDDTTIEEIGELAVYVKQLALFAQSLNPAAAVTAEDFPPNTLPSYLIARRLAAIQQNASRVSGSDAGDAHLVAFSLYADAVEVDKRSHEYVRQLRSGHPDLASLMCSVFRSSDYSDIPKQLNALEAKCQSKGVTPGSVFGGRRRECS